MYISFSITDRVQVKGSLSDDKHPIHKVFLIPRTFAHLTTDISSHIWLCPDLSQIPLMTLAMALKSTLTKWATPCCVIATRILLTKRIERVQRQAARWARGEYGMTSVTRLLKEIGWQDLADRRRHHRQTLQYKILNNHLTVPPEEVSIALASRPARKTSKSSNPSKLQRPRTSCKSSPLWKSLSSALFPSGIAYPLPRRRPIHS